MTFDARQVARLRPPPVAVHDHGDVPRHTREVDPLQERLCDRSRLGEFTQVEGVRRLPKFMQDVIARVHDVVDGTRPDGGESIDLIVGSPHPWNHFADEMLGKFLIRYLEKNGVTVHTNRRPQKFEGDGRVQRVVLGDASIPCDFSVACIGAVANRELLRGTPIAPTPFHTTSQGFSPNPVQALPTLDLPRVFVLTTSATCSASEAVMNGLAGVGVQVIQIGSTTCGKPYGFYPQDNCGTTYFSIEFQAANAQGFSAYPDGFTPGGSGGASFPGCVVNDDFTHALGDPSESLLFVAQGYAQNQTCLTPPAGLAPPGQAAHRSIAIRSPLREMRLLRRDAAPPR